MAVLQRAKSTIFGLVTDLQTLQANINAEATARIAGDASLQANINAEETARIAGDAALQANINAEETARIAGDAAITSSINAEITRASDAEAVLQANIDAEATARADADTTLTNSLNAEITRASDAEAVIAANLSAEETARADADTVLQSNIDAEVTARTAADNTIVSNLNAEITARTDADVVLQNNINAEATARAAADTTLTNSLNAEITRASDAEAALGVRVDNVNTGTGLVSDAYVANGDANYIHLATSLVDADNKLDAQAKVNADAILTEQTRASDAESAITANLDSEITRATGAEAAIQSELDATQSGAGLGVGGDYIADGGTNYITTATNLMDADVLLDAAIKVNEDDIASLDAATLKKDANLSDVSDVSAARTNLDVYSTSEVDTAIANAELNLGTNFSVADVAAMDALVAGTLSVSDNVFVADDGDTKWAIYKVSAITDGAGSTSTFVKIMDQDVYLNAISASAIKTSYESNADTNAFTDEDVARTSRIGDSTTTLTTVAQEVFAAINELDADHDSQQSEINDTQVGAGLNTDGSYIVDAGSNYLAAAVSLADADDKLDAAIKVNELAIAAEQTRASDAEAVLQGNIDAEETARIAGDTTLQSNLDAETSARIAADTALQSSINAESTARTAADGVLQANIDAEATARADADTVLQGNIDAEATARAAADTVLTNALNAEITRATDAEAVLQANIDAEATARATADTTLTNSLNAEITRATAAEAVLQANIDAEVTRASDAEAVITSNLNAEITRATAAEAAIQSELDATQVGAGLGVDGSYSANGSSNYLTAATSLVDADNKLDAALKALDDDTYSKAEVDAAIAAGGAIFVTETLTVASDQIVLTYAPKNGVVFNFATVRHTDANLVSYDIPVTVDGGDATGKTFNLSPDASGDFDTKSVTVQYSYIPSV